MIRIKNVKSYIGNLSTKKAIKNISKIWHDITLNTNVSQINSIPHYRLTSIQVKKFTFKYSNDKENTEKIEFKYIQKVNENIDEIIEKFKMSQSIPSYDTEFFIENCVFYNFENDKEKLKIILNMLCFLIKLSESRIEIKHNSNTKLNKYFRLIVKNNKHLFNSLQDYLNLKNDYEKFNIGFSNIKFFISDLIDEFIQINIDKENEEEKILFVVNNYRSIIKLIELPFFKKRIGVLLTNILNEFKNFYESINKNGEDDVSNDQLGIYKNLLSNQFQEIFYLFYYNIEYKIRIFVEEIFIKRFKTEISKVQQDNQDHTNKIILDLNFPFSMLNKIDFLNSYLPFKNKDLKFSNDLLFREHLIYIDKYLDVIIEQFTKNFSDIYYILKFFDKVSKILMFRDKSSFSDIRDYTNIILYLNYSVDHYINEFNEKNKENNNEKELKIEKTFDKKKNINESSKNHEIIEKFIDNFRSVVLFEISFYPQYKTYIYCEDEELNNRFNLYHQNCNRFFSHLKDYKINSKKSRVEYLAFDILDIISSAGFNFMHSKDLNFFMDKNYSNLLEVSGFNTNYLLKYNYKFIISWIYYGVNSKKYKKNLDELLIKFLKSSYIATAREKEAFLSNLTSIFYNLLLNEYTNFDLMSDYLNMIIISLKCNNENQLRNLFRLNLIFEILKIKFPDFYHQFEAKTKEIERILKIINEEEGSKRRLELMNKIWWNKEYYNKNKYNRTHIFNSIKAKIGFENIEFFPVINNIHYTEFLIGKKKYLEFLGPFQINNFLDEENLDSAEFDENYINKRYKMKKMIFDYYGYELIQIPFEEIIDDLNNINKYI